MKIAGVRFRENWRIYDFDATGVEVSVGDPVIVESDRGAGFARVVRLREAEELPPSLQAAPEQPAQNEARREAAKEEDIEVEIDVETPGDVAAAAAAAPVEKPRTAKGHRKVVRKATGDDIQRADKNRAHEAEAFSACQDMIAERELPMKLIRAEYSFDETRVTFYFFSENRVDFRELVKDLAHKLRSRIEMRQVGVRDVARIIGGYGPCGRELCCTSFLRGFEPVSIRMAKKQDMVLNPAKISGVCGRLLCCLSYEFEMYDAIKKDLAEMKESSVREKQAEEERRLAAQRQDAEERRREDERAQQEQKQRDRQRGGEQRESKKQEKKKEPSPEQKQRSPQEQQRGKQKQQQQQQQQRQKQQQQPQQKQQPPQQKPQPAQPPQPGQEPAAQDAQQQQPGEKGQGKKRRRRFWRDKKKKKQGGGEGPQMPGGPAGGGA